MRLWLLALALCAACASSDPNAKDCHPGCDGGDWCCPWHAKVCHPDAGCAPGTGFVCMQVDATGCPPLSF